MDFYFLLGVDREASLVEIKRAYKRLARKYHPDINPGDRQAEQQFRQIAEAYETLIDPDRRQRYDTAGSTGVNVDTASFGFEGFDFSVRVSGDAAPTFGDLFAEVFRQEGARPERGADLHLSVRVSFEDSLRGGTRQVSCHAPGALPRLSRHRARAGGGTPLRSMPRHGHRQVDAEPHGVLEGVHGMWAVPACRRMRGVRSVTAVSSACCRSR
ncbi:MAG: DnaJ domain-containing protein [Vicinamibacterales bacterium]